MTEASANPRELVEDLRSALDWAAEDAVSLRAALLGPYQDCPADAALGPPVNHDFRFRPDGLERQLPRIVAAGGPTRFIERLQRGISAMDHLASTYISGLLAGNSASSWRADVERIYGELAAALEDAESWLSAWSANLPVCRPDLSLLDQLEMLTTEDLAAVLGVGPEQAARRRREGEFGEVTTVGKRVLVRSEDVRRALRAGSPTGE